MFGYSSHGHYAPLDEILELETERGNVYTQKAISNFLDDFPMSKNAPAIWVTLDPLQCAKDYVYGSDYHYMNNKLFISTCPEWELELQRIDLSCLKLVCSDTQGGYLYVLL